MSMVKLVPDICTIEVPVAFLNMDFGEKISTPKRLVVCELGEIEWYVEYYPAGFNSSFGRDVSLFVRIEKNVDVRRIVSIQNTYIQKRDSDFHTFSSVSCLFRLASHEELRESAAIQDGKFVVTCELQFEVPIAVVAPVPPIRDLLLDTCPQVTFDVDDETFTVNKAILCGMSSVFEAMFHHDTLEAVTGHVKIEDFDAKTVQNATLFINGIKPSKFTLNECFDMLKFADKYEINGFTNYLEWFLIDNINPENICDMINYAWTFSCKRLKFNLAKYISEHCTEAIMTAAFADLEPTIMAEVIRAAVNTRLQ
uniref:BTB domain-containing protein n=1 Tax=Panagrellus redivivus TaxID=6233 RepID=A0A7E4ZXS9_PANRE